MPSCKLYQECREIICSKDSNLNRLAEHYLSFLKVLLLFFKANQRKFGYDAGYIKDEYGCNLSKCKCAPFDGTVIGKFEFLLLAYRN